MKPQAENLLINDGEVYYYASFFESAESDELFEWMLSNINWQQRSIKIFGKTIKEPRLTAFYGDQDKFYKYSGTLFKPEPWPVPLLSIKNKITEATKMEITSVLLNHYRNGEDSMGWHRDNEPELGQNPEIASVSFGACRKFNLRHKTDKNLKLGIMLEHGSLLIMKGSTQHNWEHSLLKSVKISEARINMTFRKIL